MTKKDIIEVVAKKANLTNKAARDSVQTLLNTIRDSLKRGEKVVLTGFAVTNPQLMAGSLRYCLDNWIYGSYSTAGGGRWRKEFEGKGSPLTFPENP